MPQVDEGLSDRVMALAKRRGFFWPSYDIYGGSAGFFDFGPLGCATKNRIENIWREIFVHAEGNMEIDCPSITPEVVFKASGHVSEFTDFVVQCTNEKCAQPFRADHLLEGLHPNADSLDRDALREELLKHDISCPICGETYQNPNPEPVNLMFQTSIRPINGLRAYLRPETAQGIFTNFHLLYRLAREQLPFGIAQLGRGHRNEISPRQGMIRLREFHMAELEVFVDPEDKSNASFPQVKDQNIPLKSKANEGEATKTTLETAIKEGHIANEMLATYIGRTYQFLIRIGLHPDKVRFRQHLDSEMAHYAQDCWDAEALTSFGWIELVGIADRSAYDLTRHAQHSRTDLTAFKPYDEPRIEKHTRIIPDLKALGPMFRGDSKEVARVLEGMDPPTGSGPVSINLNGKDFEIPNNCFEVREVEEKVSGRRFTPNVIEPSFGIDRIFYCVMEHAFWEKKDNYRVMRLRPEVSPYDLGVFPLMKKDGLAQKAAPVADELREKGFTVYYDQSDSIGRRYARMDEAGTPFCITVDHDTLSDDTVTIRERDGERQLRVPLDRLTEELKKLKTGWDDLDSFFPK